MGAALTCMLDVEREVAERSILIKNMMEDIGDQAANETIPIPNVRHTPRIIESFFANSVLSGQRGCVE